METGPHDYNWDQGSGWEHTRVGSRSLTAPRSACSLRAYIGSISGVVDVQSFWFWILSNDHLQQFTNNYKEGGCFYYFVAKLSLKGTHLNVKKKSHKKLPTAQGAKLSKRKLNLMDNLSKPAAIIFNNHSIVFHFSQAK